MRSRRRVTALLAAMLLVGMMLVTATPTSYDAPAFVANPVDHVDCFSYFRLEARIKLLISTKCGADKAPKRLGRDKVIHCGFGLLRSTRTGPAERRKTRGHLIAGNGAAYGEVTRK